MGKKLSSSVINKILNLRKKGWSMLEIQKVVKVGYGTIYRYTKDVKIVSPFNKIWVSKRGGSIKRMLAAQDKAAHKAKKLIIKLNNIEKTIFLSALYWGEGSKSDLGLSNTDPRLIKVYVEGLVRVLGITLDDLRISIRIYEDLDRIKCLRYWSQITSVPIDKFVSVNVLKGKKVGKLPYGMCRVRVRKGGDMLKYMTALRERITDLFLNCSIKSPHSSMDRATVS